MALKCKFGISQGNFDEMVVVFGSLLPKGHNLPRNMYESQKMLRVLKMTYELIDACTNGCILHDSCSELGTTTYDALDALDVHSTSTSCNYSCESLDNLVLENLDYNLENLDYCLTCNLLFFCRINRRHRIISKCRRACHRRFPHSSCSHL